MILAVIIICLASLSPVPSLPIILFYYGFFSEFITMRDIVSLGLNTFGLEDKFGGGDNDNDDLIIQFDFMS